MAKTTGKMTRKGAGQFARVRMPIVLSDYDAARIEALTRIVRGTIRRWASGRSVNLSTSITLDRAMSELGIERVEKPVRRREFEPPSTAAYVAPSVEEELQELGDAAGHVAAHPSNDDGGTRAVVAELQAAERLARTRARAAPPTGEAGLMRAQVRRREKLHGRPTPASVK